MPRITKKPKPRSKRRILRWIFRIVLIVMVFILALLTLLYFILRSDSFNQQALAYLRPQLQRMNLEVDEVDHVEIDLLGSIDIRGLSLRTSNDQQDPQNSQLKLKIKQLSSNYSLASLIGGILLFDSVEIEGLELELQQSLSPENTKNGEAPTEPLTLGKLEDLISNPALSIIVKDLHLQDISINLHLIDNDYSIRIKQHINLRSSISWDEHRLKGFMDLVVQPDTPSQGSAFQYSQVDNPEPLKILFNPSLENHFKWSLSYAEEPWKLNIETATLHLDLAEIQIQKHSSDGLMKLTKPGNFKVDINSKIASTGNNHTTGLSGIQSIFPLKIDSSLQNYSQLAANRTGDVSFDTSISHNLELSYEQLLNAPDAFFRQFKLNSEIALQLGESHIEQAHSKNHINGAALNIRSRVNRNKQTDPLTFNMNAALTTRSLDHQQQLKSSSAQGKEAISSFAVNLSPLMDITVKADIDEPDIFFEKSAIAPEQLLSSMTAKLQINSNIEALTGTLTSSTGKNEILSFNQQQLQIKANSDKGDFSLYEKFNLGQLIAPSLQHSIDIAQNFYLEGTLEQLDKLQFDSFGKLSTSQVSIKESPGDGVQTTSVQLTPSFSFTSRGQISNLWPLQKHALGMDVHFDHLLEIDNLALDIPQKGATVVKIHSPDSEVFIVGDLSDNYYDISSKMSFKALTFPQLSQAIDVDQNILLKGDYQARQAHLSLSTQLNQQPLLIADIPISNQPKALVLQPHIRSHISNNLRHIHPDAAKLLHEVGETKIELSNDTTLKHPADSALNLDFSHVMDWPITSIGRLRATQDKQSGKSKLQLGSPIVLDYGFSHNQNLKPSYRSHISLENTIVQYPPIDNPVTLSATLNNRFNWPLDIASSDATINIARKPFLQYQLSIEDKLKNFDMKSHWQMDTDLQLLQSLRTLEPLKLVGATSLDLSLDANLKHPYKSLSNTLSNSDDISSVFPALRGSLNLNGELSQSSKQRGLLLKLYRPLSFSQTLKFRGDKLTLAGQILAPSLKVEEQLSANSVDIQFNSILKPVNNPTEIQLEAQLQEAEINLLSATETEKQITAIGHLVTPLSLSLASSFENSYSYVELNDFHLNTGNSLLDITAAGSGSMQSHDGQIEMLMKSKLKPGLWEQPEVSGSGELLLPLDLTLIGGNKMTLGGEIQFDRLSLSSKDWRLSDVNGSITVDEELQLTPDQQLAFLYTIDTDPFQRVDYARIQPYLDDHSQLSIAQVSLDKNTLGPMSASLDIKQNLINLQKLNLDLLGGHLAGQLYVDTNPNGWKFGLLGRLNNIRFNQLLQTTSRLHEQEDNPVNARVAIEFDLNLYLLEGRIDISEISVLQLMQLLELIDPEYQDEQLSQVRSLLAVSSPRWISIDMRRGLMDLEIAMRKIPKTIKIQALPLTPLLRQITSTYLQQLQQIPLARSEPRQQNPVKIESVNSPED